eukprot:3572699-Alexandrium_andersonii.AAC.1
MLRRSNCKVLFPQLARWHSELGRQAIKACQEAGKSVTIGLRHFGRLPKGALAFKEVPYGMDTGWVGAHHTLG